MNATRPTGLGEPKLTGKLNLFRPPQPQSAGETPGPLSERPTPELSVSPQKRIRTTLDLTWDALQIIQNLQGQHRLQTGKVLPLWKAVSQMVESFGRDMKKEKPG